MINWSWHPFMQAFLASDSTLGALPRSLRGFGRASAVRYRGSLCQILIAAAAEKSDPIGSNAFFLCVFFLLDMQLKKSSSISKGETPLRSMNSITELKSALISSGVRVRWIFIWFTVQSVWFLS